MRVRELKEKANTLYSRGKYRKSRELYESALALDPTDSQLHLRLAQCCQRAGDVQAASRSFATASAVLLRAGHVQRAHAALKLALELKPRDEELLKAMELIAGLRRPPSYVATSQSPAESRQADELMAPSAERALKPERYSNSARALSLEIPIVVEEEEQAAPVERPRELAVESLPPLEVEDPTPVYDLAQDEAALDPERLPAFVAEFESDTFDALPEQESRPLPPVEDADPNLVRISERAVAVRSRGGKWTVLRAEAAISEELVSDVTLAELVARESAQS